MERTFIAIKPDGVQRGLIGPIIQRFEQRGYRLVGLKLMRVSRELAEKHYQEHVGKPFFGELIDYITRDAIVAMVWEGHNVVAAARKMLGATNPQNAEPGTIRGDFGIAIGRNIAHGSDSLPSAEREIALFFQPNELAADWTRTLEPWIHELPLS